MFLVRVVKFGEFEVVIGVVLFPLIWDFSSSPEPGSLDDKISFNSVNTNSSESIFSKVVKISNETILQIASQISDFSFSFVEFIVRFPKTPSFGVIGSPESLESFLPVFSIDEVSLEVIENETRFRERVKRVFLLLLLSKEGVNIFLFFFFFLFLWLLLFGFLLWLLFLWLFSLLWNESEVWDEDFLAKPSLSEESLELLMFHEVDEPFGQAWDSRSSRLIKNQDEEISELN